MEIKKIKLRMLVTATVVLIAFASACQPQSLTGTNPETTPTSIPAAQPTATETRVEPVSVALSSSLVGKEWTLIAYGDPLNPVVVEPGTHPTAIFGVDGTLSGNGSCNNFSGGVETDGQSISFGPIASTMMACEVGMEQEAAYLAAFENASSYEITRAGAPFKERLLITYDSGKVYTEQLVFDADLTLVDTHWVLTAYGNPDQPTLSEPGIVTTASFDADGILSGTGGCNRYTTSYAIEDGTLSVALPASTLMACAAGMDQEYDFLQALESAESYQIIGDSLEISYQAGAGMLHFSASHLPLENVRWTLARIDGQPLPEGVEAHLTLTPDTENLSNQVNGKGGCNNFFGTYKVDGSGLSFPDPFGSTQMMCEEAAMQVEQDFISRLGKRTEL
jgi:heat shock protein HslJ